MNTIKLAIALSLVSLSSGTARAETRPIVMPVMTIKASPCVVRPLDQGSGNVKICNGSR